MQSPAHWAGTEPYRILAADGTAVGDPDVGLDSERLRDLLRRMIVARRLDRECIALQRQGELTVYPGFEGQEAAQIGSATALGPDDFVFPTFRELAVALVRGVDAVDTCSTTAARGTAVPTILARRGSGPSASPSPPRSSTRSVMPSARSWTAEPASPWRTSGTGARARETSTRPPTSPASGRSRPCCSARTTDGPSACPPRSRRPGRSGDAPRAMASRGFASTATTCSRCTPSRATRWRAPVPATAPP